MTAPSLSDADVLREWRRQRMTCTAQVALGSATIRRTLEVTAHAHAQRQAERATHQRPDIKRLQANDID
ncbi:hypothetical protein HI806_09140 [Ralstonia solanacearum]|nr:hypothetical protein BCR16_08835 [Ralstonia solanacearum FJAT-1458]QKL71433.1 hypothetical protein HI806_09140 [Ralstonia solanacearum]QKL76642.1 hypothetical protein HI805_09150 [Ralstonia solanacearum]QKL81846.1 hypothetical protein HI804_09150 [Ralstonia solanacearum]QKL87057.1 hypothetical protein HI803_09155 [Ralstonia solanacearum]